MAETQVRDGAPSAYVPPAAAPVPAPQPAPNGAAPPEAALPRDTTPTYELELLVSGAVLVGLFQVPPALSELTVGWALHYGLPGIVASMLVGVIVRAALFVLIGCFVLHLGLRGFWAALVGVNSMFPGGIRWERLRESGPIAQSISRERLRPLPETIRSLDNAASLVFATGFVLAVSSLGSIGIMAVGGVLMTAVSALGVPHAEWTLAALMLVLLVVFSGAAVVDVKTGGTLRGTPARLVHAILRSSVRAQPASVSALASTMRTNIDGRVAYGAGGLALLTALGFAMWTELRTYGLGRGVPSTYEFFAAESETRAVQTDLYDNLRDGPPANPRAPSIQSDVVTEPYVRLFVPYIPVRHNAALPRACPTLTSPRGARLRDEAPADQAAADRILACARLVHRPALDGRPLDSVAFRFYTDPGSGRHGFRLLIPATTLSAGEHTLTVWPAVADGRPPARTPYTIPFWR